MSGPELIREDVGDLYRAEEFKGLMKTGVSGVGTHEEWTYGRHQKCPLA